MATPIKEMNEEELKARLKTIDEFLTDPKTGEVDPDVKPDKDLILLRLEDIKNKTGDQKKIFKEMPENKTNISDLSSGSIDYSELMKKVTGAYPESPADLEKFKQGYSGRTIFSSVPLSATAKEIGLLGENQNFSEVSKTPEFQQFMKDMQESAVKKDRADIAESGDAEPINKDVPVYGDISNSVGSVLSGLMYPAGIEAVKTGANYKPIDAAVETGINVAESVPWGAPLRAVAGVGKVIKAGEKISGILPKIMTKVGRAPYVGSVATNALVPAGREAYNYGRFDKDAVNSAEDVGLGTAVNLGTPIFLKGMLRGAVRATRNPAAEGFLDKVSEAVSKKQNVEDVLNKKASLYKKLGIAKAAKSEKGVSSVQKKIIDDYNLDLVAANKGILTRKEYRDLLESLGYEGNQEAAKWGARISELTPKNKLTPKQELKDLTEEELAKLSQQKEKLSKVGSSKMLPPDEFAEGVRYTASPVSYYNKRGKLTDEAVRTLQKKGSSNPMDLEEIPKSIGRAEKFGDYYDLASTYTINKLGSPKYASRVVPYIDLKTEERTMPKALPDESPEQKEDRWSKGFAFFDEKKTPEYKSWYDHKIKRLAD